MDQDLRKTAAAKMLQLHEENKQHEKQARAIKLLFKQVELGCAQAPSTYNELLEKVASLSSQDLDVVEKALEFAGGNLNVGKLDGLTNPAQRNASETFEASILDDV